MQRYRGLELVEGLRIGKLGGGCFQTDVNIRKSCTLQALGWRSEGRYLPLQCDMASVAYWYQTLPTAAFPELPDRDYLEVI